MSKKTKAKAPDYVYAAKLIGEGDGWLVIMREAIDNAHGRLAVAVFDKLIAKIVSQDKAIQVAGDRLTEINQEIDEYSDLLADGDGNDGIKRRHIVTKLNRFDAAVAKVVKSLAAAEGQIS
jgi:hypothetical protein